MAAWRVSKLEEQILALPSPPTEIRVAVLTTRGMSVDQFVTRFQSDVRFNAGKTALQNGDQRFRIFNTEDPRLTSVNHQKHINDITDFAPDVIVVAMGSDFTSYYLSGIEQAWTGTRRPFYITTDLNYTHEPFKAVVKTDDLRRRISGTRPGASPALDDNVLTFEASYKDANDYKLPDGSHSGYDAFYAVGMAMLAARAQPTLTEATISAGFTRLVSGTPYDFKPASIIPAALALGEATTTINVRGTWSELDWSPITRDFDADVSMYCLIWDEFDALKIKRDAGVKLSRTTGIVEGTFSCD